MHSCSLCNLRAQGLALRNMHSLHVSTIFWFLACLWWEHDYNAVPFECWFITQSPCKCDCSLSQESIKQPQYIISFFFFLQQTTYFLLFLEPRDMQEVSERNWYWLLKIRVYCLKHAFPNTVDSIANLSTLDQSDQRLSWNGSTRGMFPGSVALPPSPVHSSACFACPFFCFLFSPCFWPFPRLWSLVPG